MRKRRSEEAVPLSVYEGYLMTYEMVCIAKGMCVRKAGPSTAIDACASFAQDYTVF